MSTQSFKILCNLCKCKLSIQSNQVFNHSCMPLVRKSVYLCCWQWNQVNCSLSQGKQFPVAPKPSGCGLWPPAMDKPAIYTGKAKKPYGTFTYKVCVLGDGDGDKGRASGSRAVQFSFSHWAVCVRVLSAEIPSPHSQPILYIPSYCWCCCCIKIVIY